PRFGPGRRDRGCGPASKAWWGRRDGSGPGLPAVYGVRAEEMGGRSTRVQWVGDRVAGIEQACTVHDYQSNARGDVLMPIGVNVLACHGAIRKGVTNAHGLRQPAGRTLLPAPGQDQDWQAQVLRS